MTTAPASLNIEAYVVDADRPAIIAGAEQLSECLGEAAGVGAWPLRLNVRAPGATPPPGETPSAIVVSLLPEIIAMGEPIAETDARWRAYLDSLLATGAPVLLCTIFRHVAHRPRDGQPSPLLERIRRLNRMAIDLSHDLGVGIVDIDRALTHIGGSVLQTDYRLGGVLAAEVGGHTLAWALLSFGLDEAIDPTLQEAAKGVLGGLQQIDTVVNRRLQRRRAAAAGSAPAGG